MYPVVMNNKYFNNENHHIPWSQRKRLTVIWGQNATATLTCNLLLHLSIFKCPDLTVVLVTRHTVTVAGFAVAFSPQRKQWLQTVLVRSLEQICTCQQARELKKIADSQKNANLIKSEQRKDTCIYMGVFKAHRDKNN